jgi:hypothetical protein
MTFPALVICGQFMMQKKVCFFSEKIPFLTYKFYAKNFKNIDITFIYKWKLGFQ